MQFCWEASISLAKLPPTHPPGMVNFHAVHPDTFFLPGDGSDHGWLVLGCSHRSMCMMPIRIQALPVVNQHTPPSEGVRRQQEQQMRGTAEPFLYSGAVHLTTLFKHTANMLSRSQSAEHGTRTEPPRSSVGRAQACSPAGTGVGG